MRVATCRLYQLTAIVIEAVLRLGQAELGGCLLAATVRKAVALGAAGGPMIHSTSRRWASCGLCGEGQQLSGAFEPAGWRAECGGRVLLIGFPATFPSVNPIL